VSAGVTGFSLGSLSTIGGEATIAVIPPNFFGQFCSGNITNLTTLRVQSYPGSCILPLNTAKGFHAVWRPCDASTFELKNQWTTNTTVDNWGRAQGSLIVVICSGMTAGVVMQFQVMINYEGTPGNGLFGSIMGSPPIVDDIAAEEVLAAADEVSPVAEGLGTTYSTYNTFEGINGEEVVLEKLNRVMRHGHSRPLNVTDAVIPYPIRVKSKKGAPNVGSVTKMKPSKSIFMRLADAVLPVVKAAAPDLLSSALGAFL